MDLWPTRLNCMCSKYFKDPKWYADFIAYGHTAWPWEIKLTVMDEHTVGKTGVVSARIRVLGELYLISDQSLNAPLEKTVCPKLCTTLIVSEPNWYQKAGMRANVGLGLTFDVKYCEHWFMDSGHKFHSVVTKPRRSSKHSRVLWKSGIYGP